MLWTLAELAHPIVQAPMANVSMAPLVSAVCEAGGLGSLGTAVLPPGAVEAQVAAVRARTSKAFALNFFCHRAPSLDADVEARMRARLEGVRAELGAAPFPPPGAPPSFGPETLALVLALKPAVVSFHFGLPNDEAVRALRGAEIAVLATATTEADAKALEARGASAIIAQGVEAGGHRGTFDGARDEGLGLFALLPRVVRAVRVPVIAAGGIMDGKGIAAALALGASAAQLGTAFLGCPEAEIDPLYRKTLLSPRAAHTRVTTLFTGRPARAIATRFMDDLADQEGRTLAFPLQRAFTAALSAAAIARDDPDHHVMWAGQGAPALRPMPAADLVATLARELAAARAAGKSPSGA